MQYALDGLQVVADAFQDNSLQGGLTYEKLSIARLMSIGYAKAHPDSQMTEDEFRYLLNSVGILGSFKLIPYDRTKISDYVSVNDKFFIDDSTGVLLPTYQYKNKHVQSLNKDNITFAGYDSLVGDLENTLKYDENGYVDFSSLTAYMQKLQAFKYSGIAFRTVFENLSRNNSILNSRNLAKSAANILGKDVKQGFKTANLVDNITNIIFLKLADVAFNKYYDYLVENYSSLFGNQDAKEYVDNSRESLKNSFVKLLISAKLNNSYNDIESIIDDKNLLRAIKASTPVYEFYTDKLGHIFTYEGYKSKSNYEVTDTVDSFSGSSFIPSQSRKLIEPGVRSSALINIAVGEALTMIKFYLQEATPDISAIFDGITTGIKPKAIKYFSKFANKAPYDNWQEINVLNTFAKKLESYINILYPDSSTLGQDNSSVLDNLSDTEIEKLLNTVNNTIERIGGVLGLYPVSDTKIDKNTREIYTLTTREKLEDTLKEIQKVVNCFNIKNLAYKESLKYLPKSIDHVPLPGFMAELNSDYDTTNKLGDFNEELKDITLDEILEYQMYVNAILEARFKLSFILGRDFSSIVIIPVDELAKHNISINDTIVYRAREPIKEFSSYIAERRKVSKGGLKIRTIGNAEFLTSKNKKAYTNVIANSILTTIKKLFNINNSLKVDSAELKNDIRTIEKELASTNVNEFKLNDSISYLLQNVTIVKGSREDIIDRFRDYSNPSLLNESAFSTASGWYDPRSNTICILNNLRKEEERVLFHELNHAAITRNLEYYFNLDKKSELQNQAPDIYQNIDNLVNYIRVFFDKSNNKVSSEGRLVEELPYLQSIKELFWSTNLINQQVAVNEFLSYLISDPTFHQGLSAIYDDAKDNSYHSKDVKFLWKMYTDFLGRSFGHTLANLASLVDPTLKDSSFNLNKVNLGKLAYLSAVELFNSSIILYKNTGGVPCIKLSNTPVLNYR